MQGGELRAIREALDWSGRKMAAALGMTPTSVSLMENGKAPIERRTALAALRLSEHPKDAEREI